MSVFVFSFISPWMVVGRQMLVKIMYTKKGDGVGWLAASFICGFRAFQGALLSPLPLFPHDAAEQGGGDISMLQKGQNLPVHHIRSSRISARQE